MATTIKSISFKNFYNYYGEFAQNCYEFTEGLNIISADNNMGKSKFYNGVLWILTDKVYDGDKREDKSVSESFLHMASAKARKLMDEFDMAVKIIIRKNAVEYAIMKSIHFARKGENWDYGNVNFEVIKTDEGGHTMGLYDQDDKNKVIRDLIPTQLLQYVLLQGERFNSLVDLSSPSGLSGTINVLAEISELIGTCEISSDMTVRAKNLLSSKEKEVFKKQRSIEETIEEKEKLEKFIIDTKEKLKIYQQELYISRAEKEKYEVLRLNATKRERFRALQEILKVELNKLKKEKNEKEKQVTAQLLGGTHPWILMGLKNEISKFSALRDKWVEEKATMKLVKSNQLILLPDNIPDVPSLRRMLEKGVCEVCGQKASKGSEAWEQIKRLMDRPTESRDTKNDFSLFYSNVQTTVAAYYNSIPEIDQKIVEYQEMLHAMNLEIKKKVEEKEEATTNFLNVGGEKERSDKEILDAYFLAERNEAQYEKLIKDSKVAIANWEQRLVQIEEKLVGLAEGNKRIKAYRDFRDLVHHIETIFEDSKESIYNNLIASLQINANQKYKELTVGNLTSGGRLDFTRQDDHTVRVSVKNEEDAEIVGLGTGYQRMKQLAIIMAIISSSLGSTHFQYPFIADAPFSEFGDNFVENFFQVAPKVFTQSIILIKELYDPKDEHYLNSLGETVLKKMKKGNLKGTFYVNIVEGNPDMSEMETKHKRYY